MSIKAVCKYVGEMDPWQHFTLKELIGRPIKGIHSVLAIQKASSITACGKILFWHDKALFFNIFFYA